MVFYETDAVDTFNSIEAACKSAEEYLTEEDVNHTYLVVEVKHRLYVKRSVVKE